MELHVYVGQNLKNLGQTAIFNRRGRAFVIGNLFANGIRLLCPPLTMGGHVILIHRCKRSLRYMGFPYKGSATHLGAVWKIYIKQGNS